MTQGSRPNEGAGQLLDDSDSCIELGVQRILVSRRRANASGQDGEDIANIRAALGAARPNAELTSPQREDRP